MKLPLYQVDAFTDRLFGGNPAAVVLLDDCGPHGRISARRDHRRGLSRLLSDAILSGVRFLAEVPALVYVARRAEIAPHLHIAPGRPRMLLSERFAVLIFLSLLCSSSYGSDIYQWVDDQGRTNVSDSVPEKYRQSAKRIDSRQFEVSEERRKEAEARAAQDAARAAAKAGAASKPATQAGAGTPAAPAPKAIAADDCETQFRKYRESLDCFAPYVTPTGVKAEAYQKCTQVLDPSPHCGPSKPGFFQP